MNKGNAPFVGRWLPPPTRCVYVSSYPVPPHRSLPPRGKVARRKPGRMRGRAVCLLPAAKEPTLQPLISQKSKIFASFPHRGKLILNGPGQKAFSAAVDGKTFPLGGRWPGEAGSDEGPGSVFTASGKRTNVAAPHQSKIGDFCQLLPREKPNPLRHGFAVPPLPGGEARGAECHLRHGRRRAAAPLPGAARASAVVRK